MQRKVLKELRINLYDDYKLDSEIYEILSKENLSKKEILERIKFNNNDSYNIVEEIEFLKKQLEYIVKLLDVINNDVKVIQSDLWDHMKKGC